MNNCSAKIISNAWRNAQAEERKYKREVEFWSYETLLDMCLSLNISITLKELPSVIKT